MSAYPLLSFAIWLPIIAGFLLLLLGQDKNARVVRWFALGAALVSFVVTLPLYTHFTDLHAGMQFMEYHAWIPFYNINYHIAVDGISMPFVLLNSFITVLVVISGWEVIERKVAHYLAAFLMMSGLINGAFVAMDAVLFYCFFEAMLIPMYLIIGIWGGPNRVYASIKFFLYTLLGSLLMLVALIYLNRQSGGSFSILDYQTLTLPMGVQKFLFVAFFLAFAVKVPMWPVHTWLPDAHVEAPTGGSMVLAAITLKLGAYGFLRFILPILPDASYAFSGVMIALSLIAIVYVGLIALVQSDMKKLIAYSSIAHMGFVTLGLFMFDGNRVLSAMALEGAVIQMVSHGFVSAAMFFCIGVLYDRVHSRQIADYGGVANTMPKFAAFMLFFAMANAGLPATSGFVGEFMVIMGAVATKFWVGAIAATTLIVGAAYTLWMYKRVIFGEVTHTHIRELNDINKRECLVLTVLALCVLGMGLNSAWLSNKMHPAVNQLIWQASQSKLTALPQTSICPNSVVCQNTTIAP